MNTKNEKKVDEIQIALRSHGYKEDRWGNYKKNNLKRYKFSTTSFRYEKKVGDVWIKIFSSYYKDAEVVGGKIKIKC